MHSGDKVCSAAQSLIVSESTSRRFPTFTFVYTRALERFVLGNDAAYFYETYVRIYPESPFRYGIFFSANGKAHSGVSIETARQKSYSP